MHKYILFQGIVEGNRFFSMNSGASEQERCKLNTGEIAYKVIGYADTVADAQKQLYGRVFTNKED